MPVARPHVAAEESGKPGELHGLPDRDSRDDSERAGEWQKEVRGLLQRVVLALVRMILPPERVELYHLPAVADVAFARGEISPFSVEIHERQVDEAVHDQHPHHREMPVPGAAE